MRIFLIFVQYACVAFALFLCYQVGMALSSPHYDLMEVVADAGDETPPEPPAAPPSGRPHLQRVK
jgi:hypothetical protein